LNSQKLFKVCYSTKFFVFLVLPSISLDAKWVRNGITVAGGHGYGSALNQLATPYGLYIDENQNILIADCANHRIMEWKCDATSGQVVAGGNGQGNRADQLDRPTDVIVDKMTDSLLICDRWNRRVVRWPRRNGSSGETILSNIRCWGLAMDNQRFLYVSDTDKHEVRRYRMGEIHGTVVAGGNGEGSSLNQLNDPGFIFVDREQSVYVSDYYNHRLIKWMKADKEGVIIASGRGQANDSTQLYHPSGVFLDSLGTVFVGDMGNHRIMRYSEGITHGTVIVGGNGMGTQSNQLNTPNGLSLDRYGHLYVVDQENCRVQLFSIETTN
jgi:sugar lactone lactonase YvrE